MSVCECACACVCVRERERERERDCVEVVSDYVEKVVSGSVRRESGGSGTGVKVRVVRKGT